jgi:hypothetical protein
LKVFFKNIQTLLIVVLVAIVLFQRSCSSKTDDVIEPKVITNIETKWDTITVNKEVYVPKWKTQIITEFKTDTILINIPVDTLEILKDYYSKKVYVDKIALDSLGSVTVTDTITQNIIFSRTVTSNILLPTTTITSDIYINRREFYWGLGLQGRTDQLNYLGGELLLRGKNKRIYGLGIGVNQDFQPVISGRLYWKIGK